jgi:arsenate reductase
LNVLTIYGIPSCDTCRKARKWLTENGMEFRFHNLREDGLDLATLDRWSKTLEWQKILNKNSLTWRKIPEVDRADLTMNRAKALMLEQPTLVKRPVLEADDVIVVGFSPDNYEKIFD